MLQNLSHSLTWHLHVVLSFFVSGCTSYIIILCKK